MKKWIRYSSNPEERVMLVSSKHSSQVYCLNCGRLLRGEPILWSNDELYQSCTCGYRNFFTLVGDYLWKVCLIKIKPKELKGKKGPVLPLAGMSIE